LEIIFEIILSFIGGFFELLLEALAQAVFELLAELGVRCLAEPFKRPEPASPIMATVGYLIYGAAVGGLSLLLPKMFVVSKFIRIANLIITPIVCGILMAWYGRFRARRGAETVRLDTFMYGYIFALAMAIVRYVWR
jgi:hypothetical protein